MGQLTGSRIVNAIKGLFSGLDDTDGLLLKYVTKTRFKVRVYVSDVATAGTAQTATPFFTNDMGLTLRVVAANFFTPIAVTANASNNLTCTLTKVDSAGINPATVGAYTSDVAGGSTVAFVPKALTLTSANQSLPSGSGLHIAVSKAASGVAFTAATSQGYVEVTLDSET